MVKFINRVNVGKTSSIGHDGEERINTNFDKDRHLKVSLKGNLVFITDTNTGFEVFTPLVNVAYFTAKKEEKVVKEIKVEKLQKKEKKIKTKEAVAVVGRDKE